MAAARFFSRSSTDEKNYAYFVKLHHDLHIAIGTEKKQLKEELIKTIEGIPFPSLVAMSEKNNTIDAIVKSSPLDQFWQETLENLAPPPPAKPVPEFKYQPISTVHNFDMLKGLYFYNHFLTLTSDAKMTAEKHQIAEKCLKRSASYGSFSALNALCIEGMLMLKHNNPSLDVLQDVIRYAEIAAHFYWTPGYFLLANVYQELSKYPRVLLNDEDQSIKKMYFTEAYKALCVAEKLESDSEPMLHNAYRGKSLWEATHNQVNSWAESKAYLRQCAGGLLQLSDIEQASVHAERVVADIKRESHDVNYEKNAPAP